MFYPVILCTFVVGVVCIASAGYRHQDMIWRLEGEPHYLVIWQLNW